MGSVGLLILFSIFGSFLCAKARAAAGAVVFAVIALVLFIGTPVGQGLPDAIRTFMSVLNDTSTPALTGTSKGSGAVG